MFSYQTFKVFKNTYFVDFLRTAAAADSESDNNEKDNESYNDNIEADVHRCSSKWGLLKISQISEEKLVLEVLCNKAAGPKVYNFIKN